MAVVAVAVSAVVLASCGSGAGEASTSSGSTSASASTSASPVSLAATLLAVNTRLAAQTSYVIRTSTSDGLTSIEVHHGGAVSLDEHSRYGHREVVNDGHDVWMRDDSADSWRLYLGGSSAPPAAADVDPASLVGHWVLVTGTRLATADAPSPTARPVFVHPDDTEAGAHATVQGVDTVQYSDPVALSKVYVTAGADPLPVEVQSTANSVTTVADYGQYGTAPAVHAPDPAGVIDGTGFLPT